MQKNESSLPPPVPPRRKRCKFKSKQPISTSPQAKVERKHRPPPPLPSLAVPQRVRVGRKTPSPSPTQNITSQYSNALSSIESIPDNHSKASKTDFPVNQYEEANVPEELKKSSETLSANKLESYETQVSRSNSPFSLPHETNKYPPLYFTFQDYQIVMEDSSSLRNENDNDKIPDYIEESKKSTGAPFAENISFHNEREEIYFRVTTTDRPFEKCLGEWSKDYDEVVEEFKEEQPDFYIFEDYIDRSKKLNARPHLLFTEDFFSVPQDDNSASTEKSTTRVRFLIESPSTSTPDLDLDDDATSYKEFIDKQFENREKSSVQLFEVTDEEVQSIDENVSNTNETVSELNTESKMELETVEDENLSESLYGLTPNQINDSYSDWEEDVDVYTFPVHSEVHTTVDSFLRENNKLLESKENVDENITLQNDVIELVNEKENTVNNSEIQGPRETIKIFVDSSFYDLSNNNIDSKISDKETDNTHVDQNIQLNIQTTIEPTNSHDDDIKGKELIIDTEQSNEIDQNEKVELQVDKKSLVPVHKRRSTFLETMLNENDIKQESEKSVAMNCEVIAAHPKQHSNLSKNEENSKPWKGSVVVTNEPEIVLKDNMQIKVTEPGLKSKAPKRVHVNLNSNKSAGEVKGDVLNELLTNFNTIKLKPVNKNSGESIRSNELKSELKDEKKSVDVKTDAPREIKRELDTMERNDKKIINLELNSKEIIQNPLKGELKHSANASINKDVCAIFKEAPHAQRIENDNKTTTPVIVSKDQYREAVSITPGSVRSFVKYYEIHSEISNISKIKDNAFKKQKSELSLQREKIKAGKRSTKAIEKNKKTSNNTTLKAETKVKEKEKASGQSSKVPLLNLSPSTNSKTFIQKQSCMKSSIPSPKPERKKSVQFDNDHTVISPRKKEKGKGKEEEEGTFSSFIGGIRTRLKGKAPAKPEVKKVEQPKVSKQGQWRNENAAIFCIQKSPEAKTMACTAKSGNIGFLPQTETLQSNQTIVFYCTV